GAVLAGRRHTLRPVARVGRAGYRAGMIQDRGFAGASAHRESLAQGSRRDAADWRKGAEGERVVGRMLDDLVVCGVRAVHDRRVPASLANIDHIAISSTGVYVIDAKN